MCSGNRPVGSFAQRQLGVCSKLQKASSPILLGAGLIELGYSLLPGKTYVQLPCSFHATAAGKPYGRQI